MARISGTYFWMTSLIEVTKCLKTSVRSVKTNWLGKSNLIICSAGAAGSVFFHFVNNNNIFSKKLFQNFLC